MGTTATTTMTTTIAIPTPDDYLILHGPGHDYCNAGHIASSGSDGYDDCKSKCNADSSCMYFSLWSTGGANWCHLTSGCAQLAQQSWHTITVYQKNTTATTTMTTTPLDDYLILHGPGHDYCNAGHIASSESDGYADCKSRCSAESSCTYFSLWSTGGANWCHLTSGCA